MLQPFGNNQIARKHIESIFPALGLVACLSAAACAVSDTGAVDYRRADLGNGSAPPVENSEEEAQATEAKDRSPISRVPLSHKNMTPESKEVLLVEGDSVTIRLQQGFIRHCTAAFFNPFDGWTKRNCEVAVVIHAFEMNGDEGNDFDFSPGGVNQGRLVYYSDDVEQNQFLNFNNMPVYGPITYNGGPIGLDIFILEIDADDEQAKAMLKQLSKLGGAAYAPAAPALEILNSLGSALISSGSDDIDFRYSLVLDPNGVAGREENGLHYARLAAGDYVFIREEDRQAETNWGDLEYDRNKGQLFEKSSGSWYRKNSYLSMQVNRNLSSVALDLSQNTFGKFRQKLREADKAQAAELDKTGDAVKDQIDSLISERAQLRNFDTGRQTIRAVKAARASDSKTDKLQARAAAFDLIRSLGEAIDDLAAKEETTKVNADLSSEQVEYLLRELRSAAQVETVANFELFARENFTLAKVKANQETLVNLLVPLNASNG